MPSPRRCLRAHLLRLGVWSGVSVAAGLGLMLAPLAEGVQSFGGMSAAWALVNLAIVAGGLFGQRGKDLATEDPDERPRLREMLWLNQGLNAGYCAVGLTLALVGGLAGLVGAGWAVVVQGAALLVLDGLLLRQVPRA